MKKLLFALLLLTGLAAVAPKAEAGQFARVYTGCGVSYVPKAALYSPYYETNYGYRCHHRTYRSYGYYRPSYVSYPYYSDYGYNRTSCHHRRHHRPHVSIAFGF